MTTIYSATTTSREVSTYRSTPSTNAIVGETPRAQSPAAFAEAIEGDFRAYLRSHGTAKDNEALSSMDLSPISRFQDRIENVVGFLADATYLSPEASGAGRYGGKRRLSLFSPLDSPAKGTRRKRGDGSRIPVTPPGPTKEIGIQASRVDLEEKEAEAAGQPPYKDLLNSAMEYVALFRVNRPAQSDSCSMMEVRNTEDLYLDLLQDVRDAMLDIKSAFDSKVAKSIRDLGTWLSERAVRMERAHVHEVEMARSAFRARLADVLATLAFEAQEELKRELSVKEKEYARKIAETDSDIFKAKKDAHQKAYEVSKLRTHVARYQVLLRKHSITESDAYLTIDDERIKTEDVIEHYQNTLAGKEAKLAELTSQLRHLEDFADNQGLRGSGKASWHIKDLLDASSVDGGSRRTSIVNLERGPGRGPMTPRVGASHTRRNSIANESDGGGGSENGSDMSLAIQVTGSVSNVVSPNRPAPPSRAGQGRRTYFSDLSRVIERVGDPVQRSRPPTSNNLRPMTMVPPDSKTQQANASKEQEQDFHRRGGRQPGGHEVPSEPLRQSTEDIIPDNLISEEEAILLASQVKEQYDDRLQIALDNISLQAAQEKAEIVRINREFRERFEELQIEISKDGEIVEKLSKKQPKIIDLIHYVFPVGVKPNHCNKGVQCDLDAETSAQIRASSPKRRTFSVCK
ncbi:hypothetical protein HDU67_000203 [Dinochytrium kinnereticum]|nr:hypothetical protein HDU67_000203 [Dinochytrium kinnereticum]